MAWTTPRTWVTGEIVTAALMNTHVRDNLLETSAATATTAGDLIYADGANSMGSRLAIGAAGTRLVSTGSAPAWRATSGQIGDATYTAASPWPLVFTGLSSALWGSGTAIQVTITTGTSAIVHFGARFVQHPTLGSNVQLSYAITGASTVASSNVWGTVSESDPAGTLNNTGRSHHVTGLTAGSNIFSLHGLVSTGAAGSLGSPWLVVEAL